MSRHWYKQNGEKAYGATLKEARKQKLVPSITGVTGQLRKIGIEIWRQKEIINMAHELAFNNLIDIALNNYVRDYKKELGNECKEFFDFPKNFGSEIHTFIENYLTKRYFTMNVPTNYVEFLIKWLNENIENSIFIEKSLTHKDLQYGGTLDFLSELKYYDGISLVDWKTQKTTKGKPIKKYKEWLWQLAAQERLVINNSDYDIKHYLNVVISSTEPGRIEVVKWSQKQIDDAFQIFLALLKVFQLTNKI